jgi:hypothetical protein
VGFGGSLLSNLATLSADYQTYYVPSQTSAPFEQALILNVQLRLFGRLSLEGGTFVAPDGKLLYTTQANGTVSRQMAGQPVDAERSSMGAMLLGGKVVDVDGQAVMGAAILVDQVPVYSDTEGCFFLRERKSHTHTLAVLGEKFLDGGIYRVLSAPVTLISSARDQPENVIVVQRIK